MATSSYTPHELMVAVASREIRDGDVVFVGMRLPVLAYAVASSTHAPAARGLFEVGLMRDRAAEALLGTMGDPPTVAGPLWATRMSTGMALIAQGRSDLRFTGGEGGRAGGEGGGGVRGGGDHCGPVRVSGSRGGRRGVPGHGTPRAARRRGA